MRIIGGRIGGIRINPPANLPVRPTTDIAKEALFNILQHRIDWDGTTCLDLFAGTGNISFELASRGAKSILSVDAHFKCLKYIAEMAKEHKLNGISTRKADVFKFVQQEQGEYDFIFADPPYDIDRLPQLAHMILDNNLLKPDGILVIEHPSTRQMMSHPLLRDIRKYGYSSFSFYSHAEL
ncbi:MULTISPECIES: 16S rRNA (guanine(966)-N(2))-methyltransferase RsmD [Sphingobacterium]|uniref:16S rRNA (Guanine(966)-N(2))-methyltransferase RsmD n=1 Tax=Sphingobacterium populi TaxID=1812824 RepID=A0ABW5UFA1_9SPHI|nr:16S rRNA (guanine(966)-N(2))-methyltransferase RsmD [Sphingobacterium sp. CFCC 11742]